MRGLDTETHKGRVILIAVPDHHLELWRYKVRDQWRVLVAWLDNLNWVGNLSKGSTTTGPARYRGGQRGSNDLQGNPASRSASYVLKRTNCHPRYVCWNADYDAQAILKLTSRQTKEEIYRRTRSEFEGCRLRFVPSKFLWLANGKTRIQIFDLMQFYSMSLEKASRKLLRKGKRKLDVPFDRLLETLKQGGRKAESIKVYCRTDALRVEQIYEKSKEKMQEIGINFEKPVSCASIAMQRFSSKMSHTVPRYINRDFQRTYRGGRIEGVKCGYFSVAWLSDLHSAYSSVMCRLRRSVGNWRPIQRDERIGTEIAYAALQCEIRVSSSEYRCPSPVVGDTQLIYPRGSWSQWLDLETYRLMEERDMIVRIKKGWQLIPSCDERPFKDLEILYQQRLAKPYQNWALKTVMNALYGKTAEQIGIWADADKVTPYGIYESWKGRFMERRERWTHRTNFVYASAITSGIRTRMYREVYPNDVIFYATDGVMTMHPPKLDVGPGLGQWSEPERVTDLVVVGSGVYTYRSKTGKTVTKMRGLDSSLDLYNLLDRNRRVLKLTVKRNWSLAQSVRQHKYAMFNELVDVPRYLDVCFDRKRIWDKPVRMARELLRESFDSKPWFYYPPTTYKEF